MRRNPCLTWSLAVGWTLLNPSLVGVRGDAPIPEATLLLLGDFPGGFNSSGAKAICAEGSVVIGSGSSFLGSEAFIWTMSDGMVSLGDLPGGDYSADGIAISADGSTVIGRSDSAASSVNENWKLGFVWTQALGMRPLNKLSYGSADTRPKACSADGSLVVGSATVPFSLEAVYWLNGGPAQPLSSLPGNPEFGFTSFADDVSLDGTAIVGQNQWTSSQGTQFHGFHWSAESGLTRILPPAGFSPNLDTRAYLISGDGQIVYGRVDIGPIFRWTEERGTELIGLDARLLDTTPDGATIVGDSVRYANGEFIVGYFGGYIWDECYGTRALKDWLPERFGLQLDGFFRLGEPRGLSHDGRTIAGTGTHNDTGEAEAFVLYLPPLIQGDLDDDGFVDAVDLGILTTAMAQQAAGEWFCRRADLSGDGLIDLLDVVMLQRLVAPPEPCADPPPGDLTGDCTADGHDTAFLADCLTGPAAPLSPDCPPADLDDDGDVDLADYAAYQRLLLTPGP